MSPSRKAAVARVLNAKNAKELLRLLEDKEDAVWLELEDLLVQSERRIEWLEVELAASQRARKLLTY